MTLFSFIKTIFLFLFFLRWNMTKTWSCWLILWESPVDQLTPQTLTGGIKSVHGLSRGKPTTLPHTQREKEENTHLRQSKYPMNNTPECVYSLTVRGEMTHWGLFALVINFIIWADSNFAKSCSLASTTTAAADGHIQSKDKSVLDNMIGKHVFGVE